MKTKRRSWKLPSGKTARAVMRKVTGASCRIHTSLEHDGRFWVESRWCRRGWYSVLWPWPDEHGYSPFYVTGYRQFPGMTLPVYCATRQQAVDWAWALAAMKEAGAKWTVRRGYAA